MNNSSSLSSLSESFEKVISFDELQEEKNSLQKENKQLQNDVKYYKKDRDLYKRKYNNDKDYIFDLEDNSVILSSFIDWSANIAKIIDLKSVWPSFEQYIGIQTNGKLNLPQVKAQFDGSLKDYALPNKQRIWKYMKKNVKKN